MTKYVFEGALILGAATGIAAFLFGKKRGKEKAAERQAQEEIKKARSAALYEKTKTAIMQEVFGNAQKKKASINDSPSGRSRFNAINNSLRNGDGQD